MSLLVHTAYAAEKVDKLVQTIDRLILNPLIILMFAAAFVYFLVGIVQFMANTDNEEERTTGKQHMMWGLVGMLVMIGVFTILNIIMSTFNIQGINVQTGNVNL